MNMARWGAWLFMFSTIALAGEEWASCPDDVPLTTYAWVVSFSLWGSCAAYLRRTVIDRSAAFSWAVLAIEWMTAPIAGLSVFWLAEAAHIGKLYTAVAVFGAGVGAKAIVDALVDRASSIAKH